MDQYEEIFTKLSDVRKIITNLMSSINENPNVFWKNNFEWLVNEIDSLYDVAQQNYNNMTESKLTINSIEAEGYLRACQDIKQIITEIGNHEI